MKDYWTKQIRRILGGFWNRLWQDPWLVDLLCDFFSVFVGTNLQRQLQSIQKQTVCTSLEVPDTTRYVKILLDSAVTAGKTYITISQLSMGASLAPTANGSKAYKAVKTLDVPQKILLNVYQPDTALSLGTDYKYNNVTDSLQFSDSLSSYGFQKALANVQGQLETCYVLWAVYDENKVLRDNFTGILELPSQWLYKYPGAIQAAWNIKQNGANKRDVLTLLGAVGGISQPDASPAYPQVLTYKDTLPTGLAGIHVLTQVGLLFAPKGTATISNSILPLKVSRTGALSTEYASLCAARNADMHIPYAELPSTLSPANYILNTVWGPSACIIIVPENNKQDMLKALKFVANNTILGTILLAYTDQNELLYPDEDTQKEIMSYYRRSVNNGTTYKEHKKDLER